MSEEMSYFEGSNSKVGDTSQATATGAKTFNIGGNPNLQSNASKLAMIAGAVLLLVVAWKKWSK